MPGLAAKRCGQPLPNLRGGATPCASSIGPWARGSQWCVCKVYAVLRARTASKRCLLEDRDLPHPVHDCLWDHNCCRSVGWPRARFARRWPARVSAVPPRVLPPSHHNGGNSGAAESAAHRRFRLVPPPGHCGGGTKSVIVAGGESSLKPTSALSSRPHSSEQFDDFFRRPYTAEDQTEGHECRLMHLIAPLSAGVLLRLSRESHDQRSRELFGSHRLLPLLIRTRPTN
jgi:hypothetical protein